MKRSNLHALRTGGACAALVAALGLAFACSESPTDATRNGMAPLFKGKACDPEDTRPKCQGDDPPPPDPTALKATLENPAGAGVFSDDQGKADYDGDDVTARFALVPQCANSRTMSLVGVADLPDELQNQSTCNDAQPGGGWVFFRLPNLFEIDNDCGPDDCPFPKIPSFTTNKNGKVRATGAFALNAQYFVQDTVSGERFEFLFQDGSVEVTGNPPDSWHFTATEAHLYIGHQFVCEAKQGEDPAGDPTDPGRCKDFPLEVNITVTQSP